MENESRDNKLTIVNEMSPEDCQEIRTNLRNFNVEQSNGFPTKPETSINLTLKTETGAVVGGIRSRAFYQCQTIDLLWIDERIRKMGYGTDLMLKGWQRKRDVSLLIPRPFHFKHLSSTKNSDTR